MAVFPPGKCLYNSFLTRKAGYILVFSSFYSQLTPTNSVLYIIFSPFLLFWSSLWRTIRNNVSQYLKSHWLYIMKGNECLTSQLNYLTNVDVYLMKKKLNISKFTISKIQRSYIWGINRTNWWFSKLYVRISW